ncbi:hypothetical protein RJ641_009438 [Dillenia turbinata]|uniref:Uncharacterized protein n=1 Tax=Dillenia turbinata TaxID=194707 RepID=A0AAN8Z516_9MAGN
MPSVSRRNARSLSLALARLLALLPSSHETLAESISCMIQISSSLFLPAMEAEHVLESTPGKQLGSDVHSDLAANVKDDLFGIGKLKSSSSSSSSSSESEFKDILNDDINESGSSTTDFPGVVEHAQLASNNASGSSTSRHGLPVSTVQTNTPEYVPYSLPTQTPSVQVMEYPPGDDENRIPSSVFARTNTTAPVEWSSASNESLFSIHPGNMSFTRDYLILLQNSEELGTGKFMIPSPLISLPGSNFSSVNQSPEISNTDAPGNSLDESNAAFETKNTKDQGHHKFSPEEARHSPSVSHHSDGSAASCKSFAFPVLSQGEKNSLKVQSPKNNLILNSQPDTPLTPEAATPTRTAPNDAAQNRWFSCFCCPSCCPSSS